MSEQSWLARPMLALDTETTGTDPETARLVQICLGLAVAPGQWRAFTTLVNPGVSIPAEATAVHGITTEHAAEHGVDRVQALGEIRDALAAYWGEGVPVVGHNAPYDFTVLDRELRRNGLPALVVAGPVLDTLVLFRRFDWSTGGRTLGKLAERHGITFPAHDAEADALASLRILHILAAKNDLLPLIAPRDLHRAQQQWWLEQQEQARSRALGNGGEFAPQPHWPLIPATGGAIA